MNPPHHWKALDAGLAESGVPNGKHAVTKPEQVLDNRLVRFIKQVWLTPLSVDMCMGTEEWGKHADCVPAHKHLRIRIAEKATNISYVRRI